MEFDSLKEIEVLDLHAAGEPGRVVYRAFWDLPGSTMREKRDYMQAHGDALRRFLMQEPRGHKDMFGIIYTRPVSPEADVGAIYINSDGYLDMCVHGTMCAARAADELKIPRHNPDEVVFDTVNGLVRVRLARVENGTVETITVQNVPCFKFSSERVRLTVPPAPGFTRTEFDVDISFGGNFFALCELPLEGNSLRIDKTQVAPLIHYALAIRDEANRRIAVAHPLRPATKRIELVAFYTRLSQTPFHVRDTVIFADGQLDRSPCGSGTSALMTYFHAMGELPLNTPYISESLIGSTFGGCLVEEVAVGAYNGVIPRISGMAYVTGRNTFIREEHDPFPNGFLCSAAL